VLDGDDPALTGHDETVLDAAIFGPCRSPVLHAMLRGRWAVRDRRHGDEDAVFARFRRAIARIANGAK
jgi:formimidoylglutamate deiminase